MKWICFKSLKACTAKYLMQKKFGIIDAQKRMKYQEEVSVEQKRAFIHVVRGKEEEILQWLREIYPIIHKKLLRLLIC